MSDASVGVLGIGLLLAVLFLLGMPVGVAMAMVGFAGFCYLVSFKAGLHMLGSVVWETFSKYGLTVIPLFIFMGQVAFYSGVNGKLYNAAYRWVGHIRGGIAMATVLACSAFAAIPPARRAMAVPMSRACLFVIASTQGSLAVVSVLAAMFPAATVLLAWLVLQERLTRRRRAGLALALVAVGLVAAG